MLDLIPERNRETLRSRAGSEWICDVPEVGRIRCVTFRDHRGAGGIIRMIPARAISAEQLGLSREIQGLAAEAEGLILVTGPRSSGRSTLMSAFVDLINRTRSEHVITLDTLFSTEQTPRPEGGPDLGEFVFTAEVRLGALCAMYGVPFEPLDRDKTLADFMSQRLEGAIAVGERVKIGDVELIVRETTRDKIAKVGLEIEPAAERTPIMRLWRRLRGYLPERT